MDFLKRYEEMGEIFEPENIIQKKALRVNTLKITETDLIKRLKKRKIKLEKIPYLKYGYFYEAEFSLASTQEYLQGYFYIQDAASQVPAEILEPKPGEKVLDMAAAPGGKCTHLAQLMENKGVIFALEENKSRIQSLKNNIERLSATNILIYKKDARFAHDYKIKFDKILLDAPCGGNFCVEKDYFKQRTKQDLEARARLQKELMKSAYLCLKKGGTLVYSTCSLEVEENEQIINFLLEEHNDLTLEEIKINVGDNAVTKFFENTYKDEIKKARRLWPHKLGTDGFFVAKLTKC
ncbi:MAG: NOL1/NOP2/sun family putative RNA methylase [Candidatus Woesearchaeota archaeon]